MDGCENIQQQRLIPAGAFYPFMSVSIQSALQCNNTDVKGLFSTHYRSVTLGLFKEYTITVYICQNALKPLLQKLLFVICEKSLRAKINYSLGW